MSYIRIAGFSPDSDPTGPGILLDCTDLVPTTRGMEARPSPLPTALNAHPTQVLGAATIRKLDGVTRTFSGTSGSLFEATQTLWVDVSRSTAASYSALPGIAPWRFAQFNDLTFAANRNDALQVTNDTSGNFGDVSGSIKATIVETVGDFVILFNTSDATFGDSPNRWWCSGIGNGTTFAPTLATQAATGTLAATPGGILAAHQLGADTVVAYKDSSMYLGRYVGPPAIWAWSLVTEAIGAPSQEAVVFANDAHYFLNHEDAYVFDGTRPTSIGTEIKEWLYANLDHNHADLIRGYHEAQQSRLWWFLPTNGSDEVLDTFLVYHYKTGKWGKGSLSVEALIEFIGGGLSYDDFGSLYNTWEDAPQVPYNFPSWLSQKSYFAFFDTAHSLQTLTGTSSGASLLTGWLGFDGGFTFGHRVRPRFSRAPVDAQLCNRWQPMLGGNISSADTSYSLIDGKFDFERSERWHGWRMDATGDFELLGNDVEAIPDGLE